MFLTVREVSRNIFLKMRVVKESGSRSSDTEEVESEAGTDREAGDSSAPAPVFTELLELTEYSDGAKEWKEVARWVKYEETVEEAGNRWTNTFINHEALLLIIASDGASPTYPPLVCKQSYT